VPRLRTIVAFFVGVFVALLFGLVPPDLIATLREWAGRPGPDGDGDESASAVHDAPRESPTFAPQDADSQH
jgi:hypothetical protein